ncbi:PEP-CTERM sorting domain-containing protein [Pseudoduganella umbonata]|uniref:PEP-CTERM sorting domain-containing protein n=1 Tax=Pseudoduganella umbonata TaxID=864828 RepID=A0ABX5UWQ0_9BURK|nr:PEP-CTERM sorting domain-containing protein [Pseudoduganella umbonata]
MLTPVPEPAAWALWLAGLPAVAAVARRRARRRQEPRAA